MEVFLYVFLAVFTVAVVGILVVAGIAVVQQRRTPLPQRVEQVRQKLLESETPTGAASLQKGHIVGVSDDMVRELADAEGFRWTGYTHLNDQVLTFQRIVPRGEGERDAGSDDRRDSPAAGDAAPVETRVLAQLRDAQAELDGACRIEVTGYDKNGPLGSLTDLARAHGWTFDRLDRTGSTVYAILRRPGAPPFDRSDQLFIKGPSLAELRRNPAAVREAATVARDRGINPLSDDELSRVHRAHTAHRRTFLRWGWPAALLATALLVVLLLLPRTTTLAIPAAALAVGFAAVCIPAARAERARRAAVRDYAAAYEQVVAAALRGTRGSHAETTDHGGA